MGEDGVQFEDNDTIRLLWGWETDQHPSPTEGFGVLLHTQREVGDTPATSKHCNRKAVDSLPKLWEYTAEDGEEEERLKKQLGDCDSITQEIVGSAHVENYALKMFLYADNEDRAGRFHKNMIKSFYTASLLLDTLTVFGELTEENFQHRKYARWKATYIHNCLKNGETPESGPIGLEGEDYDDDDDQGMFSATGQAPERSSSTYDPRNVPSSNYTGIQIPPGAHAPANTPAELPPSTGASSASITHPVPQNIPAVDPSLYNTPKQGEARLTPEDFARAQKYCKYAGSALQYEDVNTAVQNLQKALMLLTTGRE
ncbi:PREDICTED: vacuolar protein sorting-associated protein VTA1 homolog [Nanorana parkeri]|uniref:vacuolar protein sorting-associated protein VTA1 homolog n=1 Tax=Nanorana parkeri TaxID=125878 RepID=UPI000853F944|nr:PREDICTED: vacuolar protein sorting-associated protein VTA1 homolog [Nanorana parkeri]